MAKSVCNLVRNVETGGLFIQTPDNLWAKRLSEWRKAFKECGGDESKCLVPCPMPWGHVMFNGRSTVYRPVEV